MAARNTRKAMTQSLRTSELLGVPFVPVEDGRTDDAPRDAADPAAGQPGSGPVPTGDASAQAEALADLHREHDRTCAHCTVAEGHQQTVFGEGHPNASLMFVGEAPGAEEDRTGRPFVGRAGQKLEEMIKAMGLRREDVYIANILKSRPPNNRTPLAGEIAGCAPFLARQIGIIRPDVIVALGGPASKFMLQTETGITRIRGQWGVYQADGIQVDVMPTFHPAYLLRNYTRQTREQIWSDLQAAQSRLTV